MNLNIPRSIILVFFISLLYWIYLALTTSMNISCDAIGYEELGRSLQSKGFFYYIQHGPSREPLYPMLISLCMHLESLRGFAYP